MDQKKIEWGVLSAVFFIALGLRVVLLGGHSFHMDEAHYAALSRRILHGDLLLTGGLNNDKPPLQMYLGALGLALFGESESSVRFMNALLSSLECGLLTWALAPMAGLAAAAGSGLMLAATPLHRSFGATAVMDGPLSFFMLLSFVMAIRGKTRISGLAWGLAFLSKQTALFLLPLPVIAVIAARGLSRANVLDFVRGASWVCVPLLLWSALFSHPRLGAFVGMSVNQPEVGFQLAGFGGRSDAWENTSRGALPWAQALPWFIKMGFLLGPISMLRARSDGSRAWSLAFIFPAYCIAVFSVFNMRIFDRYALPFSWALCSLPALVGPHLSPDERFKNYFGWVILALGLAALISVHTHAIPLDQQGAAGHGSDGYRALLVDLKKMEPDGAILVSAQGGLRFMGAWYLDSKWNLLEAYEPIPPDGRAVYAAEREGAAPVKGKTWRLIKSYEDQGPPPTWLLYKASRG